MVNAVGRYEVVARADTIGRHLKSLRLKIPLFSFAAIAAASAWIFPREWVLLVAAAPTGAGLLWLSLTSYRMSKDLGRFLVEGAERGGS
jgi:hypothetical protein